MPCLPKVDWAPTPVVSIVEFGLYYSSPLDVTQRPTRDFAFPAAAAADGY